MTLLRLVARDLGVNPFDLVGAIVMATLAAPFIFGLLVGLLIGGVQA